MAGAAIQRNETDEPSLGAQLAIAAAAAANSSAPELLDPFYAQVRDQSRFWVQRVAVPCLTLVGLFGNAITIIIMTRRRMRSTTNMYLAALAFVDMLYLVLTFLLGLSHYPNVATRRWYAYWRLRPFLMMLTDACSNTSVWLTVTFTIERFIAVKYPIKGKVWCTEARAKRLIVCVFVFGILFASPVPFEWEVKEGRPKASAPGLAAPAQAQRNNTATVETKDDGAELAEADLYPMAAGGFTGGGSSLVDDDAKVEGDDFDRDWGRLTDDGQGVWDDLTKELVEFGTSKNENKSQRSELRQPDIIEMPADDRQATAHKEEHTLTLDYTEFGANETYKTIYYWSTAVIFCFVPLILLTLFNGFLIRSVHSSRRKRNLMTSTQHQAAGQQQQQAAAASRNQRALTVRDRLGQQSDKLGRARLLIKKGNCSPTTIECKSAGVGPHPSKAIIRPSHPNLIEQPTSQHQAACMRNSIIKLPPPPSAGARCSSCAKVTFRQAGGTGKYDERASGLEYSPNEPQSKPVIVNVQCGVGGGGAIELGGAAAGLAQIGTLGHAEFSSTCDTNTGDDNQLATSRCLGEEAAFAGRARVEAAAAAQAQAQHVQANLVRANQSDACRSSEQYDGPTERNQMAIIDDDSGDNKFSKNGGGSMENLQQSKSTLARSRSAIGGIANGRFVGNNNHFRSHQLSFRSGGGKGADAGAGMLNDAGSLRNDGDNGSCTTTSTRAMPPHAAASSQERRITIMLIAVVILFLVCQIPSAGMLLYTSVHEPKPNTNEHALLLAFGNIFNFLMAVNAAGNFILYSFLSKKYRNTFVTTFCKCAWGRRSSSSSSGGRSLTKSRANSGGCDRQSTKSHGCETSTSQHLVSSYQSTTTTGGGANSLASFDDTTRCSNPARLVRFCKSVRYNATSRGGGGVPTGAGLQPLEPVQPVNGRANLL